MGKRAARVWLVDIDGLGNLLRHEYRRIDPDILWSLITDHRDTLDDAVSALLEEQGPS